MLDEERVCPGFLPLEQNDVQVTENVLRSASLNEDIPISEYIRKEFYFNCAKKFQVAIKADPALIKIEIQKKLKFYDELHSMNKSAAEELYTN